MSFSYIFFSLESFECDFSSRINGDDGDTISSTATRSTSTTSSSGSTGAGIGSYCGWSNTLIDQDNWILTSRGEESEDPR